MLNHVYPQPYCTLEFDGASKGNPGPAGAGAVLRDQNGNVVCVSLVIHVTFRFAFHL